MSKNRKNQALSEELANRKAEKKSAKTVKPTPTPKAKVEVSTTEPKRRGRPKGSTNKVASVKEAKKSTSTQKPTSDVKVPKQRRKRGTKPKVVKKQRLYGVIESIRQSKFDLDYLIGRKVKIVDETTYGYTAVILHPGYEGVEMAFEAGEIKLIGPAAKVKEFFE